MEKRRAIGLKGYFTRTLLLFFVGVLAICALCFGGLVLGIEAGIIAPANTGEKEARAEMIRQSELGYFSGDLAPNYYEYIFFDADGNVKASSLEGEGLSREISRYTPDNVTHDAGVYVFYEDGSRCLFTWRYIAHFTHPTLRSILPNVEGMMLYVAAAACILFFLLFVRGMGRKLGSKLVLVEAASAQIAGQNLDTPIVTSTGIRELNDALQSMDNMRGTLKEALIQQWESDQQRRQEVSALAHDIKTPLTIINGNAELLLEDALGEDHATLVRAILNAGTRAQRYVGALQQVANMDAAGGQMEGLAIGTILEELDIVLRPLAQDKAIGMEYVCGEAPYEIEADASMLNRALVNIGENAIRHTQPGGHISIVVLQSGNQTSFIIQDEGPGFSRDALVHAKEMFWQQDKSRTGSTHYGIGLAIAHKVARMHSGELMLENVDGGGRVILSVKSRSGQPFGPVGEHTGTEKSGGA